MSFSFRRIGAVFMRYFYLFGKLDQISDLLYWPAIDIFLWGMTTVWIQKQEGGVPGVALVLLTALIFWQLVYRCNAEISVNLLLEFWNRNLVNLFSTPLKLGEWMAGIMLLALFKVGVALAFGASLVYVLYALNVFTIGWAFLPFAGLLILSGWIFGFFASGLVIYWGQRLQMLSWMMCYIFAPFSAIFYPVEALPGWAQPIAWSLPTSYIFEGMREVLSKGHFSLYHFGMSASLSVVYFLAAFLFFKFMFEKSRAKGLARLE